jgi:hypothetical protein
MFTKAHVIGSQGLDSHDPQTIVAKVNLALNAIKNSQDDIPKGIKFMSAKTLTKGDIIFNMDSPESAEWLRRGGVHTVFMQGFRTMSEIKDREHSCVIENVPIGFHRSNKSSFEVKTTNNIPTNSVLLAHWIKPIECHFKGQQTAFMILTFPTAKATDKAIQDNLYIYSKKCITQELLLEPPCCFKCHAIHGCHIVADCKKNHRHM